MTVDRNIEIESQVKDVDSLGKFTYKAFFVGLVIVLVTVALYFLQTGKFGDIGLFVWTVLVVYGAVLHVLIFGGLTFLHRWRHRHENPSTICYTRRSTKLYGWSAAVFLVVGIVLMP